MATKETDVIGGQRATFSSKFLSSERQSKPKGNTERAQSPFDLLGRAILFLFIFGAIVACSGSVAYSVVTSLSSPVQKSSIVSGYATVDRKLRADDLEACEYLPRKLLQGETIPDFDLAVCADLFKAASLNLTYSEFCGVWAAALALAISLGVAQGTRGQSMEEYLSAARQNFMPIDRHSYEDQRNSRSNQYLSYLELLSDHKVIGSEKSEPQGLEDSQIRALHGYQIWRAGSTVLLLLIVGSLAVLNWIFIASEKAEADIRNRSAEELASKLEKLNGLDLVLEIGWSALHPRYLIFFILLFGLFFLCVSDISASRFEVEKESAAIALHADAARQERLYEALESVAWVKAPAKIATISVRLMYFVICGVIARLLTGASSQVPLLHRSLEASPLEAVWALSFFPWVAFIQYMGLKLANRFRWVQRDLPSPSPRFVIFGCAYFSFALVMTGSGAIALGFDLKTYVWQMLFATGAGVLPLIVYLVSMRSYRIARLTLAEMVFRAEDFRRYQRLRGESMVES